MIDARRARDLITLLEQTASAYPTLALYNFIDAMPGTVQAMTGSDLLHRAQLLAGSLQAVSGRRRHVVLMYTNDELRELVEALFAVILSGHVPVLVRANLPADRHSLLSTITALEPAVVLVSEQRLRTLADLLAHHRLPLTPHVAALSTLKRGPWQRPALNGSHVALKLPAKTGVRSGAESSSATGFKAYTHADVLNSLRHLDKAMALRDDDRLFAWQAMNGIRPLLLHVLMPVYAALPSYLGMAAGVPVTPERWWSAINQYGCTVAGSYTTSLLSGKDSSVVVAGGESTLRLYYESDRLANPVLLKRIMACFRRQQIQPPKLCFLYEPALFDGVILARQDISTISIAGRRLIGVGGESGSHRWNLQRLPEGIARNLVPATGDACLVSWTRAGAGKAVRQTPVQDIVVVRNDTLYILGQFDNLIQCGSQLVCAEHLEALITQHFLKRHISHCMAIGGNHRQEIVLMVECARKAPAETWRGLVPDIVKLMAEVLGLPAPRVLLLRPGSLPKTDAGTLQRARCRELFQSGAIMTRLQPVRGKA